MDASLRRNGGDAHPRADRLGDNARWEDVRGKLKNIMSLELSKHDDTFGRPCFVDGSSRKQVEKNKHFEYLMETYLPDHGGWRWSERRGWMEPRS